MRHWWIGLIALVAFVSCGGESREPQAVTPEVTESEASEAAEVVPPPGCEAQTDTISITSTNVHFNQDCVAAPADTALTIKFDNGKCKGCEAFLSKHNVAIYTTDAAHEQLFRGKLIPTQTSVVYKVPPLEEGMYVFQCNLHRLMNGTLVAYS